MIHHALSLLFIYEKSLQYDKDKSVQEIYCINRTVIDRVVEETLVNFKYELSHNQLTKALMVFLAVKFGEAQDLTSDIIKYEYDEVEEIDHTKLSMITKHDEDNVAAIVIKLTNDAMDNNEFHIFDYIGTLHRMVNNLKIAPSSYRLIEDGNYYMCGCDECGWYGSSRFLDGGGQIADTGDYSDATCPVCGSTHISDKCL